MSDSGGVVAILFTDLVGSTEVLDHLGDDTAEELRRNHFSLLRRAVAETDGTEVKSLGDGLMVSFASPVQAVTSAVAMQRAIAEHNRAEPGQTLQVRVGVHAGDPVRHEDDLHGTAVVIAKRLCDTANGGQILASDLVAALVGTRGSFCFRSAGHVKLKGLSEPTAAVTVEWRDVPPSSGGPARSPGRLRPLRQGAPRAPARPLIGRQRESERANEILAEASAGRGQVLFVVGPMGIGKTRLVEEALTLARSQDFIVLVGRTPGAGSGLAYAPVLSAFGAALRSLDPAEQEHLVGDLPHLGRLWPELRLPPPAPVQDADLERALLFEAVARLLERLSSESPVLLFLDDLHWADAPSLALLGYLVPTVAQWPVALVGTYRPEGILENKALRQFVTNARRSTTVSELALRILDPDGVAEMAASILGDAAPPSVLELSAHAAGTPLFVEAFIRGLLDAGSLVRSDGAWALAGGHPTLPPSVQDLVVDRLDLLAPEDRSTVELIAHGAQSLPHDVLERTGELDSEQLLGVVRRLVDGGLVVQEDDGPEVVYRIAHPLIQEVAAAELPAVAGRRLHARLARTVEELRPRDLDQVAYHYWRAGREVDLDRAIDVLMEAGERAHGLAAHDEAARHFGAALPLIRDGQRQELLPHLLERLGESWGRLGETAAAIEVWDEALGERERAADVRGVARLRRRLAFAAQAAGDLAAAGEHLTAGIDALRELAPSDELVELHAARLLIYQPSSGDEARETANELAQLARCVGTPRARTEALLAGVLGMYLLGGVTPDLPSARAQGKEALRIAEEAGEWLLVRRTHRELAWLAFGHGDHAAMRQHAQAQLDIDRRLGDVAHEPGALLQLGYAALVAGDFDESLRLAEEAVAGARRYDQRRALAMCLGQLAMVRIHRGDLDTAEAHLAEARQVFPQLLSDPRGGRQLILWPQAALALERGDLAGVLKTGSGLKPPMTRVLVGTAQVLGGDLDGALVTHAALSAGESPGSYPTAMADRLRGLIEHARGETDTAGQHLERSAAALDALELPFEAAVSRLHAGTVDSARQALAAFEALGAARYADKARRALRGLGVRLPSPRSGRGTGQPLSRREMEVARLVAEGLTNADIAARLVLSVRTIDSHLEHAYTRLGISSRAALARWVTAGQAAPAP